MISASYGPSWDNPGCVERPCKTGRKWQKGNFPASGQAARDGAVSKPSHVGMSTGTGRFRALWTTGPEPNIYPRHPEERGNARLERATVTGPAVHPSRPAVLAPRDDGSNIE